MKRILGAAAAALALLVITAGPASADAATVPGTAGGDISKMFADNGTSAVTVRVYGLPGPCETRNVDAVLSWGTGPGQYRARGACYAGTDWATTLEYLPTGSPQDTRPVTCAKFTMTYNRTGHFYRVLIPRTCLAKAPNKVRAYSEATVYGGSTTGGSAGPTKLLPRG